MISNEMYLSKRNKHIRDLLNKWRGGSVKLWDYTISHGNLTIRVDGLNVKSNLHITCILTRFIHGPIRWEHSALEFSLIDQSQFQQVEEETGNYLISNDLPDFHLPVEDLTSMYLLKDNPARFYAIAGIIEVSENCKPIY